MKKSFELHKREITFLSIEKLTPYLKNSRTHTDEQIKQVADSIKEFGFTNPVLVGKDFDIIAGHCSVLAAKTLKIEEIPCIVLENLTEAQKKAYVIADNKLALNAGWNDAVLKEELEELEGMGFDLSVLGFGVEDLDKLLKRENKEGLTDEDECPEAPKIAEAKLGDIYKLGNHRLICGDSTDLKTIELLMNEETADLLLTDPPYNVNYTGGTKDALKIKNDKMENESFRLLLNDCLSCAFEVMRAGAVFYIWHSDSEGYNFRGAVQDCGQKVRQCLIWSKNTMVMGRQDYHWKHEPCLYGWKEGSAHLWTTDRKQTTIIEFDRPTKNDLHPTMKPVGLMEYQIKNSSNEQDNVLDLFGGSGSTLIACEKTNRNCFMVELDPIYVDVIIKRWENFTGEKAEKLNG